MRAAPLSGYAVFAAMLTAAGLPIYIHAPKFYVDQYGVSLAALGSVLFGLRLLDVVQDPALGWLSERLHRWRSLAVLAAVALLVASMAALFAVVPPVAPLLWFALSLTGLFTAFSFLTITFYAQGVSRAGRMGPGGHVRLAAWRETGGLLGVSVAAVAPTVLMTVTAAPFAAFALGFGVLAAVAALAMWRDWSLPAAAETTGWREVLADAVARRLLLLALINATPVAVTSTLFLFFVESRLGLPGWEGPLLVLFFLSAAASAPGWGRAARRFGEKPALLAGMGLSILAFGFATLLGTGDGLAFAAICVASGAALGADMTLLPAIFAGRMARIAPNAGQAFGLWSFVSKFTLALAAVAVLPLLQAAGFEPGETASPERALVLLSLLYAALPCALKLVALALLAATPLNRETIG
ncbi:GPH family glycoside/pentoside/hexuronide:cation symporter [Rhodovulum sulfidophilum]|uniref:MFS transporter n=1 Tax=Rhodovulum sulfidophilum TaxID=35806 RepID=UPI0005A8AE03|nr:MFS transporter [Rhodovulum sulfidophilum]ANB33008.1 sugar:cation symporter [Rhodovulum sulfidophilum DSM 1374]ANB36856.1 sugar:cation symporter [Rhodovulum sulfidophilum]MCW2302593.1 GPH family glycoside/pentoside/hexuronide:cation symporter [Rhodovulum sulfidophilum]